MLSNLLADKGTREQRKLQILLDCGRLDEQLAPEFKLSISADDLAKDGWRRLAFDNMIFAAVYAVAVFLPHIGNNPVLRKASLQFCEMLSL